MKDLCKSDWLSYLNLPEPMVPKVLLLRGTRNLKSHYEKHKCCFDDVRELCPPQSLFEDLFVGSLGGQWMAYASVYGDAMASEITHMFGVIGVRMVIQTGCCGALGDNMLSGDIVCATSAHCGEGAAQYYKPSSDRVSASPELVEQISDARVVPLKLHKGPVWTTSALLAEGEKEIRQWREQGFIAVDMETASTFAVAEYFSMRRLALLYVFDSPREGRHLMLAEKEGEQRRTLGEQTMIRLALEIAKGYR